MRDLSAAVAWLAPAGLLLAAGLSLADPPYPGWDEGVHLADALGASRALASGSLKSVLLHLQQPSDYPFLHPLLVALVWLGTGVDELGARLVSLLSLALLIPALALLAARVWPDRHHPLRLPLAAALLLSGRDILALTPQIMLDITGTLFTVLTAAAWLGWLERATWGRAALTAALALAAFFTKYNYGVIVALAIVLHGVIARAGSRRLTQATVCIGLPALLWLGHEPAKKLDILSHYLWNRQIDKSLWTQWSFPAVSMARDHAVLPVVGLLMLAGWLWVGRRERLARPAGILLLFPLVQLLAQAASSAQLARYILPAVPFVALAAADAATAWAGIRPGRRGCIAALAVLVALPLALDPALGLRRLPSWRERHTLRALDAWAEASYEGKPLLLIGGFNEFPPSLGPFLGARARRDRTHAPLLLPPPRAFIDTGGPLRRVLPRDAAGALERERLRYRARYGVEPTALVLELGPGSPFRGFDYDSYNAWQEVLVKLIDGAGATPAAQLELDGGRLRARLYRPMPALAPAAPTTPATHR